MYKKILNLIFIIVTLITISLPINLRKNLIKSNPIELKRKGCIEVIIYNSILS